mmetsp:Transcript_1796/g.5106  ORF Transcript_1796/g.5106 Transcript_1796/m.5106 type:complete len:226 (+) Transcript_1796:156-833(+)
MLRYKLSRKGLKPGTNNAKQAAARDTAAAAREAQLPTIVDEPPEPAIETPETPGAPRKKQRREGHTWQEQAVQRATVCYFYNRLGCPPESEWSGPGGAVLHVRDRMLLPAGKQKYTDQIRRVLRAIVDGDSSRQQRDAKQKKLSEAEARIAAEYLIDGMGQWQAMHHANAWRKRRSLPPVSCVTVRDAAFSLGLLSRRCGAACKVGQLCVVSFHFKICLVKPWGL